MSIQIYYKPQGTTLISCLTEGQSEEFGSLMESTINIGDLVIAFTTNDNEHTLVFSKIIDSPDVIPYIRRSIDPYITGADRLLTEDVTNSDLFIAMLSTIIKGRNHLERSHIYLWQIFLSCLGIYLLKTSSNSTVFNNAINRAVHKLPRELGKLLLLALD